ncbi:Ig-like domain-containing protein [Thermincola potens]|nr:Ig-like domain-containing protein [Thermincola potens]
MRFERRLSFMIKGLLTGLMMGIFILALTVPAHAAYFLDNADSIVQMTSTSPWDRTYSQAKGGTRSWTDSPSGNYGTYLHWNWYSNHNYYNNTAEMPNGSITTPVIDLSGSTNPQLTFWNRHDFWSPYDNGVVQISTNGGTTWTNLAWYTGTDTTWHKETIDLSAYKTSNVKIRFFVSTYYSPRDGWYIDDIRVGEPQLAIQSVSPANGATNVPVNGTIKVTFDKLMDLATVNTDTFIVKDSMNNIVPGTVACDGYTATFTPEQRLGYNNVHPYYTVTVTTGARSVEGDSLAANYSWTFSTTPPDVTPPTGSISICSGAVYANSPVVNIDVSATDNSSGVTHMQFLNTNGPWDGVAWIPYQTKQVWTLTAGEGQKTVYARFRDAEGNISEAVSDTIIYDSFSIDYIPPFTKVPIQTITGHVYNGWSVSVSTDTWASDGAATVTGNTWKYTITDLVAGVNNITVTATNGTETRTLTTSINLIGYFYDYAEGTPKMHGYGLDGYWQVVGSVYASPTHCYTDSPAGNSEPFTRTFLYSDAFSLAAAGKPTLYFKYRSSLGAGESAKVGVNSGASTPIVGYTDVGNLSASQPTWTSYTADLSVKKGAPDARIRFYIETKGTPGDGLYIDDIFVGEKADSSPPTGSVLINDGAVGTNSTQVRLTLSATDDSQVVNQMQFSNDQQVWSSWEDYSPTKFWVLSPGTGTKTVYVRFKDPAGNVSNVFSDTIELDNTPPTITFNAVTSPTAVNTQTISGTASDANPVTVRVETDTEASRGYAQVDGTAPNFTWSYTITNLVQGNNNITVTATDAGGNVSSSITRTITLDTSSDVTPPTGSIQINNGAAVTGTASVTLNISASDVGSGVAKMQFSNTNGPWGDDWTVFQTTYNWVLNPVSGDGTYTVYARFKDAAGLISSVVSDTIIYDTTPPQFTINPVTTPTNSYSQSISGTVYDPSGVTVAFSTSTGAYGSFGVIPVWEATTPPNTSLTVEVRISTDGGTTWGSWQSVSNGQFIPIANWRNARLEYRTRLDSSDTTVSPKLHKMEIRGSYQRTDTTQSDFSTGTLTSVTATSAGDLELARTNLSQGKTYTKSHTPPSYTDAGNAEFTDGILGNYYWDGKSFGYYYSDLGVASNGTGTVSITVDLGSIQWVTGAQLVSGGGPSSYGYEAQTLEIQVSSDNVSYTAMGSSGTLGTNSRLLTVTFNKVQARYIRFIIKKTFSSNYLFIDEGYVFSTQYTTTGTRTSPTLDVRLGRNDKTLYFATVVNGDQPTGTWSDTVTGLVYGNNRLTLTATDAVGNSTVQTVDIYSTYYMYQNDASSAGSFTTSGTWGSAWGLSGTVYSSAPSSWTDSPAGNYVDNARYDTWTYTLPVNLSVYQNPFVTYRIKSAMPNYDYNATYGYDTAYVKYWNGSAWITLETIQSPFDWQTRTFQVAAAPDFRLAVEILTNGNGVAGDGIYIDDIKVFENESVKPYVTSIYPADGAVNVPVSGPVYALTNETLNTSYGTISITGPNASGSSWRSGNKIEYTVTHLDYNATYTATVSGARDLNGNTQDVSRTWTFTTEPDKYPPSGTITIKNGDTWTNSRLVTLTLSATDPNAGIVSMMRFSNDGVNWGPWEAYMTGRDWSLTEGDGLKTVYVQFRDSYGNISGVASDTINLDTTPPQLTLNAVVSPTNVNSQTVNGNVYDQNSATVFVYTPDTDASDGSATVVNSTSPSGTWNYNIISLVPGPNSVKVTATDPAGNVTTVTSSIYYDMVVPAVTAVSPADKATQVSVNTLITADFSEPMQAATINGTTVTVKDSANNTVSGTVSYSGNRMTFTPGSALAVDTQYTVTITTGVRDLAGNGLAANYSWQFKTVDTVLPTVSGSDPVNGAVNVPRDKIIVVTFSEPVQRGPGFGGITLQQGSTVLEATYSVSGNILMIHPNAFLGYSTVYTVTVPAGAVKDMVGNELAGGYTFSFTTVAENAPPPPFTDIAAGTDHSMAVRGDSALVGWGANDDGQLGDGHFGEPVPYPVLVRNADGTPWNPVLSGMSPGSTHTAVLGSDGSVWSWGNNAFGQLGNGSYATAGPPFSKLTPVKAKLPGDDFVYTTVYQADYTGTHTNTVVSGNKLQLNLTNVRMRTRFSTNAFANWFTVNKDGSTSGSSSYVGWSTLANAYRWVDGGSDVFDSFGFFEIANPDFSVRTVIPLTTMNGADYSFYTGTFAHDGVNWQVKYGWATTGIFMFEIKQTSGATKPFRIRFGGEFGSNGIEHFGTVQKHWQDATGEWHTLSTWWHNDNYRDDLYKTDPQFTFTIVPFSKYMNRLYAIEPYTVQSNMNDDKYRIETLEMTEGAVLYFQWGNATVDTVQNWIINDIQRELTYNASGIYESPVLDISAVGTALSSQVDWNTTLPAGTAVTVETNRSVDGGVTWSGWQAVSKGGQVPGIGAGTVLTNNRLKYRINLTTSDTTVTPQISWFRMDIFANTPAFTAAAVYSGTGYSLALKPDGTVWAWGINDQGQLGNGGQDLNPHKNPEQVPGLTGVTALAPGGYHVVALKNDGTVWTWGKNDSGQLGDGTYTSRFSPGQVPGLTGVKAVAAGANHTVVLKTDGTVWAWGNNMYGQLGTSPSVLAKTYSPVQIPGIDSVVEIGAGIWHTLARRADGTVWAWGRNIEGQVGNGSASAVVDSPAQVSGLTGVTKVAAGGYHNLALRSDGTVWAWGRNDKGQLGTGNTVSSNVPVQTRYDQAGPAVVGVSPAEGAVDVARNTHITVTFDEPVDPLSVSDLSFVVADAVYGTTITGTASVQGEKAVFTPAQLLDLNREYKVIFKPGVRDLAGNPATGSYSWSFTTVPDVTGPQCVILINDDAAYTNSRFVNLYLSSDDDSGIVSSVLLSNDGNDWVEKPYTETVSWHLSEGDGIKTVYVRFVDPAGNRSDIFSDSILLHTKPPVVTGTDLPDDPRNMAVDAAINVTFDEAIQPGGAFDEIAVTDAAGRNIAVTKTIAGNTVTVTPQELYNYNTPYTLSIPQNSVSDMYGNGTADGWFVTFTVGPDTVSPTAQALPAGGTFADPVAVVLQASETANIYYTLDGSEPTRESALYQEPISVTDNAVIKFMAEDPAGNISPVYEQRYVIDPSAPRLVGQSTMVDRPVIFSGKIVSAKDGLHVFDTASGTSVTVLDATYNLFFADFDPVNGRIAYNYFRPDTGETGLLVFDVGREKIIPAITGSGGPPFKAAITGNTLVYVDEVASATMLRDLDTRAEGVLMPYVVDYLDVDGDYLVYSRAGAITLYNFLTGEETTVGSGAALSGVWFEAGGNRIYWVDTGKIYLCDRSSLSTVYIDSGDRPYVRNNTLYYQKTAEVAQGVFAQHIFARDLMTEKTTKLADRAGDNTDPMWDTDILVFKNGSDVFLRNLALMPPEIIPSLESGTYGNAVTLTLEANKPDTAIYYTVDGQEPNVAGVPYSGAIPIETSVTLKYFGVDALGRRSSIGVKQYIIATDTAAPVIRVVPEAGDYNDSVRVTLTANEPCTIYYTVDGTAPSVVSAWVYDSLTLTLKQTSTIRYFAVDRLGNASGEQQVTYNVRDTIAPVVQANPAGGAYNSAQTVTLTVNEPAEIYYTLDGTDPRTSATAVRYTGPILIDKPLTVKYYAVDSAGNTSETIAVEYYITVPVTGISLNKTDMIIDVGETQSLEALISPAHATNKSVTWSSSNEQVATVTNHGAVTGVAAGTAVITATTHDGGYSAFCRVTVNATTVPVTGVTLNKTQVIINVGNTEQLIATVSPANANNKAVTWNSGNPAVATVSDGGVVKGISPGVAVITVQTVDGGYTARCEVLVEPLSSGGDSGSTGSSGASGGTGGTDPATDTTVVMQLVDPATNTQAVQMDAGGGEVRTADGKVAFSIPGGALSASVQLTVRPVAANSFSYPLTAIANGVPVSEIYEFGPAGLVFSNPVTVTIAFDRSAVAGAEAVAPYLLNEQKGEWELIPGYRVDWNGGTVSFEISHFSKYAIISQRASTFDDIRNHWARAVIEEMARKGIVTGRAAGQFAPDAHVTRAEFTRMLVAALGLNLEKGTGTFRDVKEGDWYCRWVETAYRAGLVKGSKDLFRPGDRITRQEMAVMVANALSARNLLPEGDSSAAAGFDDSSTVAPWARRAMAGLVNAGVINGRNPRLLAPLDRATRAEAAVMIKKMLDLTVN